jgi:hypothetical protein
MGVLQAVAEMEKGFQPFVGEGTTSPNRPLVERLVQHIVTRFPSFARALQKRCLGACGKLVCAWLTLQLFTNTMLYFVLNCLCLIVHEVREFSWSCPQRN